MTETENEDETIARLVEGVHARYGYDFRDYAPASLKRRILSRLGHEHVSNVDDLLRKILAEPECMERLVRSITVQVTSMFRDPAFYAALRSIVAPILKTYPNLRIWNAGCSTGEEVYSMAILLDEEGLLDRTRIYATDLSDAALEGAKSGIFPIIGMQENTSNYLRAGGKRPFSEYYTASGEKVIFSPALRRNTYFAMHNLATDGPFNTFHLVLCRNVMIYFNRPLQDRVHLLLHESLEPRGFLGLGEKETIRFSSIEALYEKIEGGNQLYRRLA